MLYKNIIQPLLFRLDAEQAHDYTHRLCSEISDNAALLSILRSYFDINKAGLEQKILDLNFDSPVGLAAGFDKNAHLMPLMQAIGFGFVEIGSITALPSTGNPKPRLLRLPHDTALINRMGLNNEGAEKITNRVKHTKPELTIPLGINIAKTHNPSILGDAAVRDYVTSFLHAEGVADYITINISCPNTEEGKTFEDPVALKELIEAVNDAKTASCPIFMKLSADLSLPELDVLLDLCEWGNVDGYVLTNTSSNRNALHSLSFKHAEQFGRGGLSGTPLYSNMLRLVGHTYKRINGQKPIIAVGGIDSPEKALSAIQYGASLVQVYTGLIYEGPFLVNRINRSLQKHLLKTGVSSIRDIRGHAV